MTIAERRLSRDFDDEGAAVVGTMARGRQDSRRECGSVLEHGGSSGADW